MLSPSAFKFLGAEPLLSPGDRAARPKTLTTRSQRNRRKGGLQSSCLPTLLFRFLLKVLFRNKTSLHMAAPQVSTGTRSRLIGAPSPHPCRREWGRDHQPATDPTRAAAEETVLCHRLQTGERRKGGGKKPKKLKNENVSASSLPDPPLGPQQLFWGRR